MIYKKIEDPSTLRRDDNKDAELFIQKAKLDYTMMMLDVDFPTDEESGVTSDINGDDNDSQS